MSDEQKCAVCGMAGGVRMFPIMYSDKSVVGPTSVPWSLADKAYASYSALYGKQQSLERMAQRGGFYASEMDELYPPWRVEAAEITALQRRVGELERSLRAQQGCMMCNYLEREKCVDLREQAEQRLASIDAAAKADADDLAKMRDGSKLTRAGLVEVIKYQQDDLKQLKVARDVLKDCRAFVQQERDAMFECCVSYATGTVVDTDDRIAIEEMDRLLRRMDEVGGG